MDESHSASNLVIDVLGLKISYNDNSEHFSKTEIQILTMLNESFGKPVAREELKSKVISKWAETTRVVDSHITHIRAKLKRLTDGQLEIRCIYGSGYMLRPWRSKVNGRAEYQRERRARIKQQT